MISHSRLPIYRFNEEEKHISQKKNVIQERQCVELKIVEEYVSRQFYDVKRLTFPIVNMPSQQIIQNFLYQFFFITSFDLVINRVYK